MGTNKNLKQPTQLYKTKLKEAETIYLLPQPMFTIYKHNHYEKYIVN